MQDPMYVLFAWDYPQGGMSDYVGTYSTLQAAKNGFDVTQKLHGSIARLYDGAIERIATGSQYGQWVSCEE